MEPYIILIIIVIIIGIYITILNVARELYLRLISKISDKIENLFKRKK